MKKQFLILLLSIIAATACSKKTFELQDATSKRFGGGTILSGSGVVYTFELKAFNSWEKLSVDSVYVGDRCFTNIATYTKGSPPGTKAYFEKGDVLVVSVTYSKRPLTTNSHPPKIIDGEFKENGIPATRELNGSAALIIVKMKNKFYEIPVQKFTVLEPEMRP